MFDLCTADSAKCPAQFGPGAATHNSGIPVVKCSASALVYELIQKAIDDDRARRAADEWDQWNRSFGDLRPASNNVQRDRIFRIASSRALLALLNKRRS
jgi:hypothetical protein